MTQLRDYSYSGAVASSHVVVGISGKVAATSDATDVHRRHSYGADSRRLLGLLAVGVKEGGDG